MKIQKLQPYALSKVEENLNIEVQAFEKITNKWLVGVDNVYVKTLFGTSYIGYTKDSNLSDAISSFLKEISDHKLFKVDEYGKEINSLDLREYYVYNDQGLD
jgi:hypothetical protein